MPSDPGQASDRQIAASLERLAAALDEISNDRELLARADRLRALAGQLNAGSGNAPVIVKAALREGIDGLTALSATREVRAARDAAGEALARFDESRPLASQSDTVRTTLRHIANGVLASRGLESAVKPHAQPVAAAPNGSGTGVSLDAARRLSAQVATLAKSSDLGRELPATLYALAEALGTAAPRNPGNLSELVSDIRAKADRLRGMDVLGTGAAPVGKAALGDAADAAAFLTRDLASDVLLDWIARARVAVQAIGDGNFLSFQRAPLQEACRLLADVLVYAAERSHGAGRCDPVVDAADPPAAGQTLRAAR